jgi:hypothetical protein
VAFKSSFLRPAFFILTRKEILVYAPYYSVYGAINFSPIHTLHLDSEFTDIEIADKGDYIVLTREGTDR